MAMFPSQSRSGGGAESAPTGFRTDAHGTDDDNPRGGLCLGFPTHRRGGSQTAASCAALLVSGAVRLHVQKLRAGMRGLRRSARRAQRAAEAMIGDRATEPLVVSPDAAMLELLASRTERHLSDGASQRRRDTFAHLRAAVAARRQEPERADQSGFGPSPARLYRADLVDLLAGLDEPQSEARPSTRRRWLRIVALSRIVAGCRRLYRSITDSPANGRTRRRPGRTRSRRRPTR